MGESDGPSCSMTVQIVVDFVRISALAHRSKSLVAIVAIAACDLERDNDTVSRLDLSHRWPDCFDYPADFVTHDITLLHLDNDPTIWM